MKKFSLYETEVGQTLAEYAIIIAFAVIALVGVIPLLQRAINSYLGGIYYLLTLPIP